MVVSPAGSPRDSSHEFARTAIWMARLRAYEHLRPDRLFSDPFARVLAELDGPVDWLAAGDPFTDPALAVRTRFLDDMICHAAAAPRLRQVVVLACGMDCRAFRLPWPPGTALFELDQPAVLRLRDQALASVGARAGCRRTAVGVDLTGSWTTALCSAGFRTDRPTLWVVEGLLYYLTVAQRDDLVRAIGALSAGGSVLLADYVRRSTLENPSAWPWLAATRRKGCGWLSGSDRPVRWLTGLGWRAEVVPQGVGGADYGRWSALADLPEAPRPHGRYLLTARRDAR